VEQDRGNVQARLPGHFHRATSERWGVANARQSVIWGAWGDYASPMRISRMVQPGKPMGSR